MGLQLQVKSFKPIAASTTSVAGAQTLGGAGDMTLAGTASTFNGTNTASLVTFTSTIGANVIIIPFFLHSEQLHLKNLLSTFSDSLISSSTLSQ